MIDSFLINDIIDVKLNGCKLHSAIMGRFGCQLPPSSVCRLLHDTENFFFLLLFLVTLMQQLLCCNWNASVFAWRPCLQPKQVDWAVGRFSFTVTNTQSNSAKTEKEERKLMANDDASRWTYNGDKLTCIVDYVY